MLFLHFFSYSLTITSYIDRALKKIALKIICHWYKKLANIKNKHYKVINNDF